MSFIPWTVVALVSSAHSFGYAQACSSVLSVAEASGLTTLLAGVESLEGSPQSGLFLTALRASFPFPAQFTIYAPSDAAFQAAFPGGLPAADVLGGVLVNHVANGAESSADLAAQAAAAAPDAVTKATVGSGTLNLTAGPSGALFIGLSDSAATPARIVTPDLETCAGTLHIINRVMLPSDLLPPPPPAPAPPPPTTAPPIASAPVLPPEIAPAPAQVVAPAVPDRLPAPALAPAPPPPRAAPPPQVPPPAGPPPTRSASPEPVAVGPVAVSPAAVGPVAVEEQCASFSAVIAAAGLDRLGALVNASSDYPPAAVIMAALTSKEPTAQQFTVFAPQNSAVRAVLPGNTGPGKSVEVLSNHVALGAWDAATLLAEINEAGVGGLVLPTLGDARLTLTTDGVSISVLPEGSPPSTAAAVVQDADYTACGGVLHIIDAVLMEGTLPVGGPLAGLSTPNVVEFPAEAPAVAPSSLEDVALAPSASDVLAEDSRSHSYRRATLALASAAVAVVVFCAAP